MSDSDSDDSLLNFEIYAKTPKDDGKRERKQTKRLIDEGEVLSEDEFDLNKLAAEVPSKTYL